MLDSEIEVKTTTIDDFCRCEGISRIGFLKIDVEGHEPQVVAGASRMLGEKRIDHVFAEYVGCRLPSFGYSFRDFLSLFTQVGYQPEVISLSLMEAILRGEVPEKTVCANFLFRPSGRVFAGARARCSRTLLPGHDRAIRRPTQCDSRLTAV